MVEPNNSIQQSQHAPLANHPVRGLIINLIDVECDTPFEFATHFTLRRATLAECEVCKKMIDIMCPNISALPIMFEAKLQPHSRKKSEYLWSRSLEPEDWHYWVIEISDKAPLQIQQTGLTLIDRASRLTSLYFECNHLRMDGPANDPTLVCRATTPFLAEKILRENPTPESFIKVTKELLQEIGSIYENITRIDADDRFDFIIHAINMYHQLLGLPTGSQFYVVGQFAVLESLINKEDREKKITHRIPNKMALLNNRMAVKLDTRKFGELPFIDLWVKLFQYRSTIAHGEKVNFNDSKYKELKNRTFAVEFLDQSIKQLLQLSLREPELINDLRPL